MRFLPARSAAALALMLLFPVLFAPLGGCLVASAVKGVGDVAVSGVEVAGKTTVAVVKTTGHVVGATVGTSGDVASDSMKAAGKLARTGTVTFLDTATGAVVRVPWQQGLTLAGASAEARVQMAARAVEIIRQGRLAYAAAKADRGAWPLLASGDVVRLGGR